jgi:transglutaminase-like putative cysteine protease
MLIRVGFDIEFELPAPAPMVLMLSLHPSRMPTVRSPEVLKIEPFTPSQSFVDSFGNCATRISAPAGRLRLMSDAIVQDSGLPDEQSPDARQHPVEELPDDALQFLLSSRYCEVDLLKDLAWELFSATPPGWARVKAVCTWVHNHLEFSYPKARSTRTAAEAHKEKLGVCRDFTHLAITFCRCLNIPARYTTGYLGDIGVPHDPSPMDFSAWFEAYLGGCWWTFDARHNKQRIGRVVMARGRDAVDVALTTTFGVANLVKFDVKTDQIQGT